VTTAPFWRLEPPTSTKDQNGHLFFFGAGERGIMENKLISSEMYDDFTTTYAIGAYRHGCCGFDSRSERGVLDTTLCDQVCQGLAASRWFSTGTPDSFTNKTDRHDITELLVFCSHVRTTSTNICPYLRSRPFCSSQ
jgi:hypothetical protein